jgi:SHS2 domain-containing protein
MSMGQSGYREIEHTADWELEAWGPDLDSLFESAARGMYSLAGTRIQASSRLSHSLNLSAQDVESLLVAFLTELLYLGEQEGMGFDRFDLHVIGNTLQAQLEGALLLHQDKEIKAVTYHQLEIRSSSSHGLVVKVVFDV